MKIILSAFCDKMKSEPMDIPENHGFQFKMILTQPLQNIYREDYKIGENQSFLSECLFEWTGEMIGDCRKYILKDISKF